MRFEPSKKKYYRFPSAKSIEKMDKHMYFPEIPVHASDDSHYNYPSNSFMPEKEHNHDSK